MLAEIVGLPVYKLKEELPTSEYFGWQQYLADKNKALEKASKPGKRNLLDGSTQDLIKGLTGNG